MVWEWVNLQHILIVGWTIPLLYLLYSFIVFFYLFSSLFFMNTYLSLTQLE